MNSNEETPTLSKEDIHKVISFLKTLASQTSQLSQLTEDERIELFKYSGQLTRPDKKEIQKRNKEFKKIKSEQKRQINKSFRKNTGIRSSRDVNIYTAPLQLTSAENDKNKNEYTDPHNCYVCKATFKKIHHFYDSMCPPCAELNYSKRFQKADLTGQVALITGSRLKIGYQATLLLLRAGATVIATTRFPKDSALRYAKEEEFKDWGDRLHIYGLDLRHTPSVEIFARYIENKFERLDILINNAAQTVRRPSGFYSHLMENEKLSFSELPSQAKKLLQHNNQCLNELDSIQENQKNLPLAWNNQNPAIGLLHSAELSQIPYTFDQSLVADEIFPEGKLDMDLQQVDLRKTNSWRLKLGEIPVAEMLEVQLVNAVAPFVLVNRLIGLMRKENTGKKHIVNVTAMEGKFHRFKKADRHPHTNMAKAALNMMTHTSASDFAKDGIYMNAVDTGWVTDEDPVEISLKKQEVHDFHPPLDIVDGAARVCDPFFDGINSDKHWCGQFLKDYFPIDW